MTTSPPTSAPVAPPAPDAVEEALKRVPAMPKFPSTFDATSDFRREVQLAIRMINENYREKFE